MKKFTKLKESFRMIERRCDPGSDEAPEELIKLLRYVAGSTSQELHITLGFLRGMIRGRKDEQSKQEDTEDWN